MVGSPPLSRIITQQGGRLPPHAPVAHDSSSITGGTVRGGTVGRGRVTGTVSGVVGSVVSGVGSVVGVVTCTGSDVDVASLVMGAMVGVVAGIAALFLAGWRPRP